MPSTVIRSFTYDPDAQTLVIHFVSGAVYAYRDVPQQVYTELSRSGTKGVYYNLHIKKVFRFERLPNG